MGKPVSAFYLVVIYTLDAVLRFYDQFLSKFSLLWHFQHCFYVLPFMDFCWLTTPPSQSAIKMLLES